MLKRAFVAPDPGRVRLRFASRAVLGIGLAVVLCGAVGHSLVAAITGGLAALLALFTVTDTTVRGQAVTTALLPVVGLPVLALAAVLHGAPLARDLAFLAVVGAGVYARRWGPRGHSLGVFAFMMFFASQFLHTVPGQLPELYEAVLLSLGAAAFVRFGVWCYERRLPGPVAVAAPAGGKGLARITTRQAVQATVGAAFALAAGQVLSDQRWYWAVGATWWVFVATTSRGETVVRGFRRFLGTVLGIVLGFAVAMPLHHDPVAAAVVVAVSVFGIFYTAHVSYTWMMLAVTVMASMLYGLLGVLDPALLALRVTETAAGALGAVLAVLLVLPVSTHSVTDAWVERALRCVHACTAEAAARLAGGDADPAPRVAELEAILGRVRLSLNPLVHPLSPMRSRKARARKVLALLDECAREVRGLASVAADPEASHDARLAAACWRVESAVEALTAPAPYARAVVAAPQEAEAEQPVLAHLHALERALVELAVPLRGARRASLGA
ncbi:FUSC family protein [Streptomyces sp. VRA16 Mangrove soil]|uniref:FUSC family protein n=1 Tax=Streptomyces sp. VRA16 Mangrove soil TaxID=2817434 RepID=UPI001A9FCD5A|nr:FUSC family protein [Streptomyces sp. VRA16 Mangrove soil]MBO1330158.1 FUSC family protein [Streptomyces sp. VRA16 Mangrove soil]